MFNYFYKSLYFETFNYYVNLPKQTFIDKLDELFLKKKGYFKKQNLVGKFIDYPDTFIITPKWWFVYIRNFERDPAILKGVATKISDTETKIEIAVRPNSVFLILFVVFLLAGLFTLFKFGLTTDIRHNLMSTWLLIFGLPTTLFMGRFAATKLRKSFENYFDLTLIE